jgi:hypothetical protein
MGHDIRIISSHKVDTTHQGRFTQDLYERLVVPQEREQEPFEKFLRKFEFPTSSEYVPDAPMQYLGNYYHYYPDDDHLSFNAQLYTQYNYCMFRWWGLCDEFTKLKSESHDTASLDLAYIRSSAGYYAKKLGNTDFVYYVDDQSEKDFQGIGQCGELNMTWDYVKHVITETAGDLLLNVSAFFLDTAYRENFLAKGEQPLAFIDDFQDINTTHDFYWR